MTRQHKRASSKRTLKWIPSAHTYTKSRSASDRRWKARWSSCHWRVRRVIADGDNPADVPKNPSNAGVKSPDDMPCKYINGSTSTTFGDVRHHGGTIDDLNCIRFPLAGSTRWSFTRGAS